MTQAVGWRTRGIPLGDPHILPRTPNDLAAPDTASASRDGAAALLPAALCDLLAREHMAVARVEEISALGRREGPRRTFRIELSGGRLVKARTLRDPEVAARMSRWLPLLAPRGFAALYAVAGAATLEEWVAGSPALRDDDATAEQAGALLGACHAVLPAEVVRAHDARLVRWQDDVVHWIEEIRAAGCLAAAQASRLCETLRDARPRAATWGLYHGDFAPENLVENACGLRCVDNTTVGPHLLEVDAGFTFNRWPLCAVPRERFLRGYRRHADPGPFLESERFWRISAAVRSAAWRIRERTGGTDLPLREIALLVD